ncbi:MAG: autotransporter-associated beta strand repeat-containing protein, partial [Elusimicrobia bacterium]|nr:autotransporter-associated beta strand repeat-containing protein [Elusimicrobiota bacterium]
MINLRRLKSHLAVLCVASFLTQQAQAVAIGVTTTADSGAGSLRTAVTAAAAGDTIQWGAGGEGTIVLLTDLPAVADKTTIDVSAALSSVTIAAANMSLAGGVTFQNGSAAQDWAIATNIIGVGSMTKTGAGTLVLTGANSYAAGTFLNGGTLNINAAYSLGTGALTFDNGKLQTASTIAFTNAITFAVGGGTIDTLGNSSVFSGVIGGVGGLTNVSTGTLILTGANTYIGGTVLNSGKLNINADAALGDAAGGVTFNGGTLQIAADMASARAMTLNAGGGTFDTNSRNLSLSGVIGGAGALTKTGGGLLTLSGANA